MSSSTTLLDQIQTGQSAKEVTANRLFAAMSPGALFGIKSAIGLTWNLYGGAFNSTQMPNVVLTLTDAATNYIDADPATGIVSVHTAGFATGAIHLYTVTVSGGTATAYSDWRQAIGNAAASGGTSTGAATGTVNVFTKNQSVLPAALTDAAAVAVDASASNNFKLILGQASTALANPTNLTDGMTLNFAIKQDATGGRGISFGSMYRFSGGTTPALSTAPSAISVLSFYYDADSATLSNIGSTIAPPASGTARSDPYFNYVSIGMHFDADFTDLKSHVFTSTNVVISTTTKKFGTGSASFNGTNAFLSTPASADFDFGTGDFTIEMFLYQTASTVSGIADLTSVRVNAATPLVFGSYQGKFYAWNGATILQYGAEKLNVWTHIALTRSGTTISIWQDGALAGSDAFSGSLGSSAAKLTVGGSIDYGQYLGGFIDELRMTKGVARYTAPFTPPTAAF